MAQKTAGAPTVKIAAWNAYEKDDTPNDSLPGVFYVAGYVAGHTAVLSQHEADRGSVVKDAWDAVRAACPAPESDTPDDHLCMIEAKHLRTLSALASEGAAAIPVAGSPVSQSVAVKAKDVAEKIIDHLASEQGPSYRDPICSRIRVAAARIDADQHSLTADAGSPVSEAPGVAGEPLSPDPSRFAKFSPDQRPKLPDGLSGTVEFLSTAELINANQSSDSPSSPAQPTPPASEAVTDAEPVAFIVERPLASGGVHWYLPFLRAGDEAERYRKSNPHEKLVPLYATPQEAQAVSQSVDVKVLIETIKTRLRGVHQDDVDVVLDDDEWDVIVAALSALTADAGSPVSEAHGEAPSSGARDGSSLLTDPVAGVSTSSAGHEAEKSPALSWAIDRSTESPILTYDNCSVIQDEQAFYVLGLIERDNGSTEEPFAYWSRPGYGDEEVVVTRLYAQPTPPASEAVTEAMETQGPYEARFCKDLPTSCCDYGVISLSEGREVCRVWREQDARAIAAALSQSAPGSDKEGL